MLSKTPYFAITALGLALLGLYALFLYLDTAPVVYEAPAPTGCTTFDCIVDLRTKENFERDYLKYMEQARLSALQELNLEAQDMVYVSPYVTTPN